MKPAPFVYHAPETLDDALGLLAELGPQSKVLAGGQSLIPLLSMRLAAPEHLVDLGGLAATLGAIVADGGGVRVGALARHAELERHDGAAAVQPLLRRALRHVAHPAIRNRGTTVGSLAHADPAGEMPAVLAVLAGSVELVSRRGTRTVQASDFFVGPLETALRPDEIVASAHFPAGPPRGRTAFCEVARRRGDYAVCGVATAVTLDPDGRIATARAAYVGVADTPLVLDLADAVVGQPAGRADFAGAGRLAAARVRPDGDIHASAEYRRHLVGVLSARALAEAVR